MDLTQGSTNMVARDDAATAEMMLFDELTNGDAMAPATSTNMQTHTEIQGSLQTQPASLHAFGTEPDFVADNFVGSFAQSFADQLADSSMDGSLLSPDVSNVDAHASAASATPAAPETVSATKTTASVPHPASLGDETSATPADSAYATSHRPSSTETLAVTPPKVADQPQAQAELDELLDSVLQGGKGDADGENSGDINSNENNNGIGRSNDNAASQDAAMLEAEEAAGSTTAAENTNDNEEPEFEMDSSPYTSDVAGHSLDSDSDSDSDDEGAELMGIEETARAMMSALQDDDDDDDDEDGGGGGGRQSGVRTKNEVPEEAPPKPDLVIGPGEELVRLGQVLHTIGTRVVIKSERTTGQAVLESGSVLCKLDRTVIAALADVFGNTQNPFYVMLFRSVEEMAALGVVEGLDIYYPTRYAQRVFVQAIRGIKGSDASNVYDEEVGDEEVEFSDDEKEMAYKRELKAKRRGASGGGGAGGGASTRGKGRGNARGGRGGNSGSHPLSREVSGSAADGGLQYDDKNDDDGPYRPLSRPANFGQGLPPQQQQQQQQPPTTTMTTLGAATPFSSGRANGAPMRGGGNAQRWSQGGGRRRGGGGGGGGGGGLIGPGRQSLGAGRGGYGRPTVQQQPLPYPQQQQQQQQAYPTESLAGSTAPWNGFVSRGVSSTPTSTTAAAVSPSPSSSAYPNPMAIGTGYGRTGEAASNPQAAAAVYAVAAQLMANNAANNAAATQQQQQPYGYSGGYAVQQAATATAGGGRFAYTQQQAQAYQAAPNVAAYQQQQQPQQFTAQSSWTNQPQTSGAGFDAATMAYLAQMQQQQQFQQQLQHLQLQQQQQQQQRQQHQQQPHQPYPQHHEQQRPPSA